ncbi:MAG: hypothetical protein BYD32DRAFT_285151 [Podila humilis]|nr:MAG: hypothetical protein BYD32DRAFT_285151 [Podila humilis]
MFPFVLIAGTVHLSGSTIRVQATQNTYKKSLCLFSHNFKLDQDDTSSTLLALSSQREKSRGIGKIHQVDERVVINDIKMEEKDDGFKMMDDEEKKGTLVVLEECLEMKGLDDASKDGGGSLL